MHTSDNLLAWRLLLRLAKTQNLTRASIEEDIELSAASRLLKDLETSLNVSLLDRQTRPLRLKEEVRSVIPQLASFIEASQQLVTSVRALEGSASERAFRLSIPANVPRRRVMHMITAFTKANPDWKVEVMGSTDHWDVIERRVEASYLPYCPADGLDELRLDPIAKATTFMVATPAYLRQYGTPRSPADLAQHRLILRNGPYYPLTDRLIGAKSTFVLNTGIEQALPPEQWILPLGEEASEESQVTSGILRHSPVLKYFAGDTLSCCQAVIDDAGIAVDLSIGFLEPYLKSGQLVVVLPEWHRPLWHATLVTRPEIWKEAGAKAFLEHFMRHEKRDSHCWIEAFEERGLDAEAMIRRDL